MLGWQGAAKILADNLGACLQRSRGPAEKRGGGRRPPRCPPRCPPTPLSPSTFLLSFTFARLQSDGFTVVRRKKYCLSSGRGENQSHHHVAAAAAAVNIRRFCCQSFQLSFSGALSFSLSFRPPLQRFHLFFRDLICRDFSVVKKTPIKGPAFPISRYLLASPPRSEQMSGIGPRLTRFNIPRHGAAVAARGLLGDASGSSEISEICCLPENAGTALAAPVSLRFL